MCTSLFSDDVTRHRRARQSHMRTCVGSPGEADCKSRGKVKQYRGGAPRSAHHNKPRVLAGAREYRIQRASKVGFGYILRHTALLFG